MLLLLALGLMTAAGSACGGAITPAVADTTPQPAPASGAPAFSAARAPWLYQAPSGAGLSIGGITQALPLTLNTHDGGFDFPVEYTDGSHGCTTFTDTLVYQLADQICVPNPAGGYFPSQGAWGADDGHLAVVNTSNGDYFEFWKLSADAQGNPVSTNVGQIVTGNLHSSNGTPGTTAAQIAGLAGDILPGELDCETCLRHALNAIVPAAMNSTRAGSQAPAVKTDGTVPGAVFREGAKLRLDPGVNVEALQASPAAKAIMLALQRYGAVITDQTGGNGISLYSALASQPDLSGLQQAMAHLEIYY